MSPLDPDLPLGRMFALRTPKHAPIGAMAPAEDLRSVGELLLDADHQARALLLDVDAADAPGLLRTWVHTMTAAAQLWDTLPDPHPGGDPQRRRVHRQIKGDSVGHLERASILATSVGADLTTARWPPPGPGDHRMGAIADNLSRARQLVAPYANEISTHRPLVQRDLEAARTRVVHTVYVATHAVVVALNDDGRRRAEALLDPRLDAARTSTGHPRVDMTRITRTPMGSGRGRNEVGPAVRWSDRLGVAERVLGDYLRPGHYAAAMLHERAATLRGLPRLQNALARFDIQAHRTLVEAPTPAHMVLVARTEAMFFGATLALSHAALECGAVGSSPLQSVAADGSGETSLTGHEPGAGRGRLEGMVAAAGEAWTQLAGRWQDLTPRAVHLAPALAGAAAELRATCRELTHEHTHLAVAATIRERVDLVAAVTVLAQYCDAAADLAHATTPALRAPIVAPSGGMAHRLAEDIEAGLLPESADETYSDLIHAAARGNHQAHVPGVLLESINSAADTARETSAQAGSSLARLTPPRPLRTAVGGVAHATSGGPRRQPIVSIHSSRVERTGPDR